MDKLQKIMEEGLTETKAEAFREFVRQMELLNLRNMELAFQAGFSLGCKLTAESLI